MQLADTIDTHVRREDDVSLGMLIELIVLNRLLNPKAPYKINEWAERAGVCHYYNVTPERLNEDRLGLWNVSHCTHSRFSRNCC